MANTVKLKRGSGSDPSASDLVLGELAIRTDNGKIFLKKDDNSVAEVSGGGIDDGDKGDITVSNSGDTWTIDNDAVTYAKIQNVSATNRILGRDSSGAGVIEEISPSSMRTMINVEDGATADQTASEIVSLLSDQNISTTGTLGSGDLTITGTQPAISFVDSNHDDDFKVYNNNGILKVHDITNSVDRVAIHSNGDITVVNNLDVGQGLDVTGNITVTGTVDGVDIATRNTLFGGLTSSSGVLTNGVTATTQSASDNSTKVATTAYTDTAISNLINGAPAALDTLNELAAAMNDDAAFSTTVTNSIATKLPLAGGTLTGDLEIPHKLIHAGDTDTCMRFQTNIWSVEVAGNERIETTDSRTKFFHDVESTGTITGTFSGNITGNVTGNTSGSAGSCTGNAATATALATARTIAGVSFDGTANISLNNNAITNGAGYITATLTEEQVEDYVGGMVTGNTETGITVTYQDSDGTLDFVVASQTDNNFTTTLKNKLDGIAAGATNVSNTNQLTNGAGFITATLTEEQVEDYVGGMVTGNTETGITVTYQDSDGTLDFVVASQTDNNFTTTLKNKLDGIESGATADQTASEILTLLKTVDGSGSGLDADTLDGVSSASFLRSDAADTITQSTQGTPTLTITNSGGAGSGTGTGAVIAKFEGDSDGLLIRNIAAGDYGIYNTQQNNGMEIMDGTGGVRLLYNGTIRLEFDSGNNNGDFKGVPSVNGTSLARVSDDITGNAATATALATARTIAGVSFDGSANISLNNNAITNGAGYITSASANDGIFWENDQAVSSNYTITNNKNAMSAGPITINSGVTVTVGSGENWTIV